MNNALLNLNEFTNNLFLSIENELYANIDNLLSIKTEILKEEPLKLIFYDNNGMEMISFLFLFFYFIYYIFDQIFSLYNGNDIENIYYFIFKSIIILIIINNNHFLIETILEINEKFELVISNYGKEISGHIISFEEIKNKLLNTNKFFDGNLSSLRGIIKSIIMMEIINILILLSIRYVNILICIFIFPIMLTFFCMNKIKGIFYSYLKLFFINLILGNIIKIILIIPISYNENNDILYQIVIIGTLYIISKITILLKELFFKISKGKNNVFEMR